jgi:hypothetical protein
VLPGHIFMFEKVKRFSFFTLCQPSAFDYVFLGFSLPFFPFSSSSSSFLIYLFYY